MGEARKERQETRAQHKDPINYTCGECRRVHKFNSKKPYICEDKKADGDN